MKRYIVIVIMLIFTFVLGLYFGVKNSRFNRRFAIRQATEIWIYNGYDSKWDRKKFEEIVNDMWFILLNESNIE